MMWYQNILNLTLLSFLILLIHLSISDAASSSKEKKITIKYKEPQPIRRFRRQTPTNTGCLAEEFTCYSGECVPMSSLCDGTQDCSDRSDESYARCRQAQCPGNSFRCAYGGCIERSHTCDGNSDCWDDSDELLGNVRKCNNLPQATCPICKQTCEAAASFGCLSGECIDSDKVCDGSPDCQDGSDETYTQCRAVRCPSYSFRCQYGGCVDAGAKCNGQQDCADGSDEDEFLCGCRLPNFPERAYYKILGCPDDRVGNPDIDPRISPLCKSTPGVSLAPAYTGLGVKCETPYELPPSRTREKGAPAVSYCINGKWKPNFPICRMPRPAPTRPTSPNRPAPVSPGGINRPNRPGSGGINRPGNPVPTLAPTQPPAPVVTTAPGVIKCPALILETVEPECILGGRRVTCLDPVSVGTEAKLSCKSFHSAEPEFSKITCRESGQWNRQPFICKPECGERVPKGQLFVVQGREAEVGQFPWHAGIYFIKEPNNTASVAAPKFWCGGSLLNRNFILSAAHCFWDDSKAKARTPEYYKVGLGKFFRDWSIKSDYTQLRDVRRIEVHPDYRGYSRSYVADIALVWVKEPAVFTPFVRPVCVDWQNTFEREQLANGNLGQVAGWGKDGNGSLTETLQFLEVPYVEYSECEKKVPADFKPLITTDKICAGYTNGSSVCNGDSGGGLAFEKNFRWFVRAIVSVGPVKQGAGTCNPNQLTAYTRVSVYRDWIEDMRDSDVVTGQ